MYVIGWASRALGPGTPPGPVPIRVSATLARERSEPKLVPVRPASSVVTIWPTLCRLPA